MNDGWQQFASNLVKIRDKEEQSLGGCKRGGERARYKGAMECTGYVEWQGRDQTR